jgi:hypothetical protein
MLIDHTFLQLRSEGDVESKLITPFVTSELYMGVAANDYFTQDYMPPSTIDKGSKTKAGYFPDFSIWMHAFPIMIIEAKLPAVQAEQGYRDAALYAQQRNMRYPTDINPCRFIMATNGRRFLFGYWDSQPIFDVTLSEIPPGSAKLAEILEVFGNRALRAFASECLSKIKSKRAGRPSNLAGGEALINSRKPLNSFAAELSPILRRYFSSAATDIKEISEKAYVSSAEITEYDKVLESLLRDRVSIRRDTIVESLQPERHGEVHVERAIADFAVMRPQEGQLQIIQGAVGSGKSLFIRRYHQVLQPDEMKGRCRWAWVNFNNGPPDLSGAERWLCESFIASFSEQNPELDLSATDVLKGIFARQIQRRKGIYDDVAKSAPESAARIRAEDLIKWQDDPLEYTKGLANYIMGVRHREILIVVMDNVDRLDLKGQLNAFQLTLWFMEQTRAFIFLQMRDETYERYKNKPPLDTFRTGIAFHISPPRFIDVVKRRLDLSIGYLAQTARDVHTYTLPSGARITIPSTELGKFLHELYVEIFERRRNISRILESLAGLDVRRALEMFVSIITSGHLGEDQITSQVRGEVKITEQNILKILMRAEYRFFSDNTGFVTNIFHFENDWKKPNNFILPEILFYLAQNRKRKGQAGVEGYFSIRHLADEMQRIGVDAEDTLAGANYLLKRYLINADHMNNASVDWQDCVKISASGYIHLRILAERVEYIFGVIPTTTITDDITMKSLGEVVARENSVGYVSEQAKSIAVNRFFDYLYDQAVLFAERSGRDFDKKDATSGTIYVLRQVWKAMKNHSGEQTSSENILD